MTTTPDTGTDFSNHRQYLDALNAARVEAARLGVDILDDRPMAAFHRELVASVIRPLRDALAAAERQRSEWRALAEKQDTDLAAQERQLERERGKVVNWKTRLVNETEQWRTAHTAMREERDAARAEAAELTQQRDQAVADTLERIATAIQEQHDRLAADDVWEAEGRAYLDDAIKAIHALAVPVPAGDTSHDEATPCCDMHNALCEPPTELCCERCTEAKHYTFPYPHADGSKCVLTEPDNRRTCRRCGTSWTADIDACPQCQDEAAPAPVVADGGQDDTGQTEPFSVWLGGCSRHTEAHWGWSCRSCPANHCSPHLMRVEARTQAAQHLASQHPAAAEPGTQDGAPSVAAWNAAHPVGTLVRYWRGIRDGKPSGTGRTTSEAWLLSGHTPVVLIDGTSGAIALTHVDAATPAAAGDDTPDARPDIHDAIEAWHNGDGYGTKLHEYLGFLWEDYARWAETGVLPKGCRYSDRKAAAGGGQDGDEEGQAC